MKMSVCKTFTFDAAHYLPNYDGKCRNMHGHTWSGELEVSGEVDETSGMVIDFALLKEFLEGIKGNFDHTLINDIIPNPTAENICLYIKQAWNVWAWGKDFGKIISLERIRLYESPGSFTELKPG